MNKVVDSNIDYFLKNDARMFGVLIFLLSLQHEKRGPFVYRLGHQVFILERGVRLPYGLHKKTLVTLRSFFYSLSFDLEMHTVLKDQSENRVFRIFRKCSRK